MNRLIAASTLAIATMVVASTPTALAAQTANSSPVQRYHLMQLSVKASHVALPEFQAKTESIRSCEDARSLVEPLDADWRRNRFISASNLPSDLRAILEELPSGSATPVFAIDQETMSVIVLCNRT